MFKIIQVSTLLKVLIIMSTLLSVGVYTVIKQYLFPSWDLYKIITISSFVSTFVIFILLIPFFARKIWGLLKWFNGSLYPDLNGEWVGCVMTETGLEIDVRAVIRQGLLLTEIDMHGKDVKSVTLECTPTMEQGQKKLYYVYRSTSRIVGRTPYDGSTLFDVLENERSLSLSGNYYTDRKTVGRIYLTQVSKNNRVDVSYY
ncbi:hypothetical protein KM777_10275 [Vibrio splendidus]|nr:hypothetical protein [Vibrio splendidus]